MNRNLSSMDQPLGELRPGQQQNLLRENPQR